MIASIKRSWPRNCYNAEFGERVAFVVASQPLRWLDGGSHRVSRRGEIIVSPLRSLGLAWQSVVEPGLDPCAALQLHIDLQPGESQEVFF